MKQIKIELTDNLAQALAHSSGWRPSIVDETAPAGDDGEYPLIDNPVPLEEHLSVIIQAFISNHVKEAANTTALNNINSMYARIVDAIKRNEFSDDLIAGDNSALINYIINLLGSAED